MKLKTRRLFKRVYENFPVFPGICLVLFFLFLCIEFFPYSLFFDTSPENAYAANVTILPSWKVTIYNDHGDVRNVFYSHACEWNSSNPPLTVMGPYSKTAPQAYIFEQGKVILTKITKEELEKLEKQN